MKWIEKIKENPALRNFIIFLSILGPGIITGSVDNDAGGITTYSVAGALYGYKLIWTLIPAFIILAVVQEMNARMGIVTGKGLADLIRENFGVKITFFIFLGLVAADIGNTATEFAGVAGSMMIFGISKYVSVPLVAIAVWMMLRTFLHHQAFIKEHSNHHRHDHHHGPNCNHHHHHEKSESQRKRIT